MKTITYNLKEESTDYYSDVKELTDMVQNYFFKNLLQFFVDYKSYIIKENVEELRNPEEYIYDTLAAGVYLLTYSSYSKNVSWHVLSLQRELYFMRRKKRALKQYIDPLRGIISTGILYKRKTGNINDVSSIKEFYKLILWLEATGEFREEAKRLKIIYNFLQTNPEKYGNVIDLFTKFASWFEVESHSYFGRYTKNVNRFLKEKHYKYRWKENYIFTGRKRIEYHLSMVGAELMNRGFKKKFDQTGKRALLVPACMRINNDKCKAIKGNFDIMCSGCNPNCRVFQLVKLGKEKNFSVHIIPHSSDFTKWLETWAVNSGIGVVGVACPLNLITGGLELKSLGIPAQCVLLDYCGCKNHWDENGIPTDLNEKELLRML